ncbi:MAG: AAC(3)-IV family aminoglycoside N-acetyltransferase [Gemmatimonadota bacterium]
MTGKEPRTIREVAGQLRALGVERGGVLLVHTSFRAVRPIEGGPDGLIAALDEALGPEGTLVMPSWGSSDDEPFDPAITPASSSLGVVAERFRRQPGVRRSAHQHAFAARGPRAEAILADPLPLPPHIPASPVGRVHDAGGQVLLLGVDHDADTTVHLAELIAGVPYRVPKYLTARVDGVPTRIDYGENDHCCARFRLVDGWVREAGVQREGTVGHAHARLVCARDVVDAVVPRLVADPLLFLHGPEAGCDECDDARSSVGPDRDASPV